MEHGRLVGGQALGLAPYPPDVAKMPTTAIIRQRLQSIGQSLGELRTRMEVTCDGLLGGVPREAVGTEKQARASGIFGDLDEVERLCATLHLEMDRLG